MFTERYALSPYMTRYLSSFEDLERGRIMRNTPYYNVITMRFECWMTKATETHSEYVIVIVFPRQKWLRERSSMLQYSTLPVLLNYLIRLLINAYFVFISNCKNYSWTLTMCALKSISMHSAKQRAPQS